MASTFRATMAQISVPASSANIGPGFDTLAIALDLRDHYAAQILDDPIFDVDVTGEGAEDVKKDKNHLVIKAMMKGFDFMGAKPRGIALRALNNTPHGRGLGSRSSELLPDEEIMALATELEGHPDNVAAALYGGATIAWMDSSLTPEPVGRAVKIQVDARIKAIVFIPENHLATSKARKLLPENIAHADAVANTAHVALLVHALSHRPDLLFTATEDHLHQDYRAEAMPKSSALLKKLRAAGVAATISGAGPSVLVLHTGSEQDADDIIHAAGSGFTAKKLAISAQGISA